jgi:MFS family permease
MAHGALTGMAAIYATRVGSSTGQVGLFVAAPNIGGMLLHWPVSAASDDIDRRAVGLAASLGAIGAAVLLLLGPSTSPIALLLMAALGGCSYPLYSIAAAYTNDWIEPGARQRGASQLVTLYGIGAMVGPFVAAGMMIVMGPEGFLLGGDHAARTAGAFFLYRYERGAPRWRSGHGARCRCRPALLRTGNCRRDEPALSRQAHCLTCGVQRPIAAMRESNSQSTSALCTVRSARRRRPRSRPPDSR